MCELPILVLDPPYYFNVCHERATIALSKHKVKYVDPSLCDILHVNCGYWCCLDAIAICRVYYRKDQIDGLGSEEGC